LLGVGRLDAAAVATTSLVEFVAAREAAAGAGSGVDNDAVIVSVVVIFVIVAVTTGVMVNTNAANACASAYKKYAALYVADLLGLVLRLVERW